MKGRQKQTEIADKIYLHIYICIVCRIYDMLVVVCEKYPQTNATKATKMTDNRIIIKRKLQSLW